MREGEAKVPRGYNVVQLVLTALMVLLLVWVIYTRHRPLELSNRPWVQHVADLPGDAAEKLRATIEGDTYVIPNTRYAPPWGRRVAPSTTTPTSPTMLGYSMREVSLLGMSLMAYPDAGLVLYVEDAQHFSMRLLDNTARKQVDEIAGKPVGYDYILPVWAYLWGWLLPVLIGAWVWVWSRGRERRRENAGII